LFPAEQNDFREAFPRDCPRSGNDARVFALRQNDALKMRARPSLDFLN
jgi:S-adenosylmethionine synthetase